MNSRPNVIIITTDQQRTDSLSCYGSEFVHTPNLDRLGAEGAIFRRAYCANPVCTPARASIFSGQYVSRHGAWNVGLKVPDDVPMLSHRLAELSYRTHYIGKAHFHPFGGGELSMESTRDWEGRYPDWNGPYYGFDSTELSLGHTTYGLCGHYGLWLKSQISARSWTPTDRQPASAKGTGSVARRTTGSCPPVCTAACGRRIARSNFSRNKTNRGHFSWRSDSKIRTILMRCLPILTIA